ncbi:MAG: hypothetical protein HND47_20075 [Chloroflexi bacterium]|nr:hypothetical protein [Chloroflexota bacterium]
MTLSKGGAVSIVARAGKAAESEAEAIGEQVRQSKVIGSDETSARVQGDAIGGSGCSWAPTVNII